MNEVIASFPEEWILMDTDGDPSNQSGEVLYHHRERWRVDKTFMKRLQESPAGACNLIIMQAIPSYKTGPDIRKALSKLRERGEPVGWRRW